jgi:hypothetical protein
MNDLVNTLPGAVLIVLSLCALCIAGAALLGWCIDRWQQRQWEREAAPKRRMLDASNKHDWRSALNRK